MKHFLTTTAAALSMLASPAQAATFEWWRNAEPDNYGLKISGPILKGDAEQLNRMLSAADTRYRDGRTLFTIYLDSPGGMVAEAIIIGTAIRIYGALCASACGLIWLAGDRRYLGSRTTVGFHSAYDPTTRQVLSIGLTMVRGYLASLGISQSTIGYLLQAPPEGMEWVTPDKAREHGIETWTCMKCSGDKAAREPDDPNPWSRPVRTVPMKGDFPHIPAAGLRVGDSKPKENSYAEHL
jgi:hypothetical protein